MNEHPPLETGLAAGLWSRYRAPLIIATAIGAVGTLGGLGAPRHLLFSYLTSYLFVLTTVLGVMFVVMLHHATDSGWSVVVRRPAEQCLAALPVLALLFVPIAIAAGTGHLMEWVHHGAGEKKAYLNLPFFFIRAAGYFGIWIVLGRILRGSSIQQDATGAAELTYRMRRASYPGFLLYAITFTFAGVDWVMSLEHEWFSTIFGVYVWSGSAVSGIGLLCLMVLGLRNNALRGKVPSEHVHDLGKLLFAFSVFWAYIAFSQYFLIWYANIPEETTYFLGRWSGSWKAISVLLPVGHFAVPFVVIMSANVKKNPRVLGAVAALLVAVHWLDLYWMVMPTIDHERAPLGRLWIDLSTVLLVGGISALAVLRALSKAAVYPVKDPRLAECLSAGHPHGHGEELPAGTPAAE